MKRAEIKHIASEIVRSVTNKNKLKKSLYRKIKEGRITTNNDREALAALYLCMFPKTGYVLYYYDSRKKFEVQKRSTSGNPKDSSFYNKTFYIEKGLNF